MSEYYDVKVYGIDEAKAGLRGASKTMKKELRQEFKSIGSVVADEARKIAESKGLKGTQPWDKHKGLLLRSIKPQATAMKVVVKETAKTKGYNYPKIYEYGGSTHTFVAKKGQAGGYQAKRVQSKTAKRLGLEAGSKSHLGSRAFMAPALANKASEVEARMVGVVAKMAVTFKLGGNG